MDPKTRRQDVLEAVLMAMELGDTSATGILRSRPEDAKIEILAEDLDALARDGLIGRDGDEIHLTEDGRIIAERTARRHRLTEMLLFSLLGLDRDFASEIGCAVEHSLREEMLEGVCTLLGHPATCPHGRPIPPGPCCAEQRSNVPSQIVPLTELRPGERGRIMYIQVRDHARLHKLASYGLTPGVEIELHRRRPAFCLRFDQTELAVDSAVAEDIHVSRIPRKDDAQGGEE